MVNYRVPDTRRHSSSRVVAGVMGRITKRTGANKEITRGYKYPSGACTRARARARDATDRSVSHDVEGVKVVRLRPRGERGRNLTRTRAQQRAIRPDDRLSATDPLLPLSLPFGPVFKGASTDFLNELLRRLSLSPNVLEMLRTSRRNNVIINVGDFTTR